MYASVLLTFLFIIVLSQLQLLNCNSRDSNLFLNFKQIFLFLANYSKLKNVDRVNRWMKL